MAIDPRSKKLEARTRRNGGLSLGDESPARRGGNLFIWTLILLLLIGFAIACWIGSFYIFGHPEKAFSYSILSKLNKLDPPKRFEVTGAPRGDFLNAKELLERYGKLTPRELDRVNESLLRNYIRNFKLTQDHVPYIVGRFNILDSYELTDKNLFPSGVVALAQSAQDPHVLLEHIFPTEKKVIPILQRMWLTGLDLPLEKSYDLSALLHVEKLRDGRMLFTAIPILYGSYVASTGPGSFSLEPPTRMNLEAGLPVLDAMTVSEADVKYATYRRKAGLDTSSPNPDQAKKPTYQIVRVERPQPVKPFPTEAATPVPTPLPNDAPVLPATPVIAEAVPPVPVATPTPTPSATPTPLPSPATIANTASGNWPTYSPGQMPRGRLTNVQGASDFADRGAPEERTYLQGNFVVSASRGNRAVLRAQGGLADAFGGNKGKVRIIVDFPQGVQPPGEGSTFSRDSRRPFLITRVTKTETGEVNVYVQEVTKP